MEGGRPEERVNTVSPQGAGKGPTESKLSFPFQMSTVVMPAAAREVRREVLQSSFRVRFERGTHRGKITCKLYINSQLLASH